ncbi:MAG: ferredoxin [Bacteriovoracia bacterium]
MEPKFTAHLFICTNDRGPNGKRESCCPKGAEKLRERVKDACKAKGFPKGSVRINSAGCLDQCERGIAAVLYPKGEWFLDLKKDDVDTLVDAVEKAIRKE